MELLCNELCNNLSELKYIQLYFIFINNVDVILCNVISSLGMNENIDYSFNNRLLKMKVN